jgi:hypothetical protein
VGDGKVCGGHDRRDAEEQASRIARFEHPLLMRLRTALVADIVHDLLLKELLV